MTHSVRMAATLYPVNGDVDSLIKQAVAAESAGYDDVWLTDVGAPDTLIAAAAVAQHTQNVRIGTAVVPAYTRSVPVLAASCVALQQLSQKRFVLGLGSSSQQVIEGWHGLPFAKPLERIRETAELLRQILRGEVTQYQGEVIRSRGYRQAAMETPVFLAALQPKMLELAAALGDGVILNLFPQSALPRIMEHIALGAEKAGKCVENVEVAVRHQVCVTDQPELALQHLRKTLIPYFSQGVYNQYLAWCGFEEQAEALAQGWRSKDREITAAALSDELLRKIAIVGNRDYCHRRIREYTEGGVHTHIICCSVPAVESQAETFGAFSATSHSGQAVG